MRPSGSSGLRSLSPEARSSPASNGAEIYRKERPIHAPILRAERGLDCPSSFPPHSDIAPMGDKGGRERDRGGGGVVPVCPLSDRRHRQPLTRYRQDRNWSAAHSLSLAKIDAAAPHLGDHPIFSLNMRQSPLGQIHHNPSLPALATPR